MGTHRPSKEQVSSRTNKMDRCMLNITYPDRKTNIWLREKTGPSRDGTSRKTEVDLGRARQQITSYVMNINCVSPPGNPTKGKDLEEPARRRRDQLNDYWKGTIWQRVAQDRHVKAAFFAQPRNSIFDCTTMKNDADTENVIRYDVTCNVLL